MTTAAAPRPSVVQDHQAGEWVEILAPEMFTFTKPGEVIVGCLLSIDSVTIKGKTVPQYLLRTEDNRRFQILATYDLGRKIERSHIGRSVKITYIGENRDVRKGDNCLREFRVKVKKSNPQSQTGPIADEDIPF